MKKLLITIVISLYGCVSYAGQLDYPYYHYSCVNFKGKEVCGNHYYASNGIVYYYDADKGKWVGAAVYDSVKLNMSKNKNDR